MRVTVSGGFHNAKPMALNAKGGAFSAGQLIRMRRAMCGVDLCACNWVHRIAVDGMKRSDFADAVFDAYCDLEMSRTRRVR